MSVLTLVREVELLGVEVLERDGQRVIRGEIPDGLMGQLRACRQEFLEAWDENQRHRYGKAPPALLPRRIKAPTWRAEVHKSVAAYVGRQGERLMAWVESRRAEYLADKMDDREAHRAALLDVLQWQMARNPDPVGQVQVFDEVAASLRKL